VLVVDNLYADEAAEEAERLRDPSHVRNYTETEWRALLAGSGLAIEQVVVLDKPISVGPWLERAGCAGQEAERVRELLADRIEGETLTLQRIAIEGRKA
jgi:hypothetical protein